MAARQRSSQLASVKIKTDWAIVSLDPGLVANSQSFTDANLRFTISKVEPDTLSQEIKQVIGSSPVYDFTLSLDGQKLTTFANHEVLVQLPYTLAAGENPSQVVIYYLAEDGKLEVIKNGHYDQSTGMVVFRPNHFSQYTAKYVTVAFQDLQGYDWADEAVLGLAAREVVQGRSEGHFAPKGDVTRAEFVQMLATLFDLKPASATAAFTDVEKEGWYYNAIASAQQAGLVQGKADGSFGVNDRISREDMAVLIYRIAKLQGIAFEKASTGTGNVLPDIAATSDYAREAVAFLQQAGLMNGMSENSFEPKSSSTRAQAAAVLYRLYGYYLSQGK